MEGGRGKYDAKAVKAMREAQIFKRRSAQLQEKVAGLAEKAETDVLTELPNRRAFEDRMQKELVNIEKSQREGDAPVRTAWVVLMDIDKFKNINDTKGHSAGDQVLRSMGAYLKDRVRGTDIVARWGGEEFIILFMDGDKIQARERAEELRSGIEKLSVPWDGQAIPVTMSFGVAQVTSVEDIQPGIDRADTALYKAKEGGRNRVEFQEAA